VFKHTIPLESIKEWSVLSSIHVICIVDAIFMVATFIDVEFQRIIFPLYLVKGKSSLSAYLKSF
jgi:hypothetical protein